MKLILELGNTGIKEVLGFKDENLCGQVKPLFKDVLLWGVVKKAEVRIEATPSRLGLNFKELRANLKYIFRTLKMYKEPFLTSYNLRYKYGYDRKAYTFLAMVNGTGFTTLLCKLLKLVYADEVTVRLYFDCEKDKVKRFKDYFNVEEIRNDG